MNLNLIQFQKLNWVSGTYPFPSQ